MLKLKKLVSKANIVDKKAKEISIDMAKHEYIITEGVLNKSFPKISKLLRLMTFNEDQTKQIIDFIKIDLVGKEIHKGDKFHELIKDSFTKALIKVIEEMESTKYLETPEYCFEK